MYKVNGELSSCDITRRVARIFSRGVFKIFLEPFRPARKKVDWGGGGGGGLRIIFFFLWI